MHVAAHGTIHHEHALFSSLSLADGPLTGYDLARLPTVPRVVVLAGCSTGEDQVHPGDELLGFASTLLSRGARQVVATVAAVPDAPTAPLMLRFHQHLRDGLPAADALAAAQAELIDSAYAAAAGFVCIGGTGSPADSR